MFRSGELTALQNDAATFLLQKATIIAFVEVETSGGGIVNAEAIRASNVPCRIGPTDPDHEKMIGGRFTDEAQATVYLPAGQAIESSDAIDIEGVRYYVQAIIKRPAQLEVTRAVLVWVK